MADVVINSIPDLLAFASGQYGYGSSNAYLSVELGADLDFAEYDEHYNFAGCKGGNWCCNFDGRGHTIDNIRYEGTEHWAFFCSSYFRGSIKNLNLTNVYAATTGTIAGLVFNTQSTGGDILIQNCHVSGQLERVGSGNDYVSGLVHNIYGYAYIYDSSFSGNFVGTNENFFGVVCHSFQYQQGTRNFVYNCMVNADSLTPNAYFHPISGLGGFALNCEFKGTLRSNWFQYPAAVLSTHCILVLKGDSVLTNGISTAANACNKVFIDSDELAIAGLSIPSGATMSGATTAQLKDAAWLKSEGFAL